MAQVTCWKCGGDGYIPKYAHIDKGVCYACNGTGKLSETREKELSLEAFEKGTKKGGKTKHLFTVNPKHLDRKQLEKFRTRIKTRATEFGVKLKAGFTTETALKKLHEAYKEKHPEESAGNRIEPAVATGKKEGTPKPDPKPQPAPKPQPKPKTVNSLEDIEKVISINPDNLTDSQKERYVKRMKEIAEELDLDIEGTEDDINRMRKRISFQTGITLPKDLEKPKEPEKLEEKQFTEEEVKYLLLTDIKKVTPEERLRIRREVSEIAKRLNVDISGMMLPTARKTLGIHMGLIEEEPEDDTKALQEQAAKDGYKIINPLSDLKPGQKWIKERNTKKPQGVTKIPFEWKDFEDFLFHYTRGNGDPHMRNPYAHSDIVADMKEVIKRVEDEYKGLIGNVALSDFRVVVNKTDFLGKYSIDPNTDKYTLSLSVDEFVRFTTMKPAIINQMGEEFYKKERISQLQQMKETLVHEFAHAFHHQALLDHQHFDFRDEKFGKNDKADKIIKRYEKLVADIMKSSGMTRTQIQTAFYNPSNRIHNEVVSQKFYRAYGATDSKEYFAVMSQKLATASARKRLKEQYPEDYALLKEVYEGVIDL